MNKFSMAVVKTFAVALALMVGALVIGCKSTTEPAANQEYDSEASADVQASSLGTESGGAGVSFADVMSLKDNGTIDGTFDGGKSSPMSRDTSYDPSTGLHTVTITRGKTWGKYNFSTLITYKYTFYDASGNFMQKFQKGVTDKITVDVSKQKSKDYGDRVDVDDTASASWSITNLVSGTPLLNGTYSRSGTDVFHTVANGNRSFTHSFTITFVNDTLVKDNDKDHVYLKGPATSHFEATTAKGYTFTRDTKITFNGDGTAILDVTRTSGDGTVDTYTIDVKYGFWLRKGR